MQPWSEKLYFINMGGQQLIQRQTNGQSTVTHKEECVRTQPRQHRFINPYLIPLLGSENITEEETERMYEWENAENHEMLPPDMACQLHSWIDPSCGYLHKTRIKLSR